MIEDNELIVQVNSAYAHLFGYDEPQELIGQHISLLLSPEDKERMLDFGKRRLSGEPTPQVYEFKGKRRDGTSIELEASVSTSTVEGRAFITTAIRDITERKRAEEALRQAHDRLEDRVAERTIELARANEVLRAEIAERERAEATLREHEEARKDLLQRLVAAQEDERCRLARELHDQLGQQLAALIWGLKSLDNSTQDASPNCERLDRLQDLADQLRQQVQTLAWELRPAALDDLGLLAATSNYADQWAERYGVPVDFQSIGFDEQRLPPHMETTVYRVVQEALNNVFKHAKARRVSVILEHHSEHLSAVVEDDGCGFDTNATLNQIIAKRGLGLLGMRERVESVGGTLTVESTPGAGSTVFARIPARLQ